MQYTSMLSDYKGRNAEPPVARFQIRSNKEIDIALMMEKYVSFLFKISTKAMVMI